MKIKRDFYLRRLVEAKGDGFVKILTGIRRCGKSYLLFNLFKEHLLRDGVRRENIVEIALDKKKDAKLRSPDALYDFLTTRTAKKRGRVYVFIDEVQECRRPKGTGRETAEEKSEREQQFYDILMLTWYCRESMNPTEIWNRYKARAEEEWNERANSDGEWEVLKGKSFSLDEVIEDVKNQLQRYGQVDNGEDKELKKAINDFKGLYLNSKVSYAPADVACGASLVRIMYELLDMGDGWSRITELLDTEALLYLPELSGMEKGKKIREVRDMLIERFGGASPIPAKILKGKNPQRVFWAVVTLEK